MMNMLAFLPQSLLVPARGCLCLARSPRTGTSPLSMASPSLALKARPLGPDPGPAAIDRQLLLQAESVGSALMLQPSELLPWGFKALNFYWQQGAV